jgi:hypothetical protein
MRLSKWGCAGGRGRHGEVSCLGDGGANGCQKINAQHFELIAAEAAYEFVGQKIGREPARPCGLDARDDVGAGGGRPGRLSLQPLGQSYRNAMSTFSVTVLRAGQEQCPFTK